MAFIHVSRPKFWKTPHDLKGVNLFVETESFSLLTLCPRHLALEPKQHACSIACNHDSTHSLLFLGIETTDSFTYTDKDADITVYKMKYNFIIIPEEICSAVKH